METDPHHTLVEAYCREMLSFLQYVGQSVPYASPSDRPIVERLCELARSEAAGLDGLADYLGANRMSVPHVGAFPSAFTNYNFIAVRKLLPRLVADEGRGLADLERDATSLPPGKDRDWIEKLSSTKRMHVSELEKLA